jgi:hypothetical protein
MEVKKQRYDKRKKISEKEKHSNIHRPFFLTRITHQAGKQRKSTNRENQAPNE